MIVTCTLKRVVTETCQIEIVVPDIPAGSRYLQQLEEVYEFAAELALARVLERWLLTPAAKGLAALPLWKTPTWWRWRSWSRWRSPHPGTGFPKPAPEAAAARAPSPGPSLL